MIDGQNYFDQSVKNIRRMYNNILKIAIDQGDGYTTGCLVFYPYCNEHFKVITIYFMLIIRTRCCPGSNTANQFYGKSRLSWKHNIVCSLLKKQKKNNFGFFRRNFESIVNLFCFNATSIQND